MNGIDSQNNEHEGKIIAISEMYEDYFLDYASYVILERAVPAIDDGLKPVQRRILHAMREMDDGRYNKVANIIGQTMQYHPHGDAAIGDALVNLGQKNLIIDCQGNWGDYRTGDSAAAARYIEARLNKFVLEIAFNKQTTNWQISYDGRKNEPVALPMKFPMLLALGVEGIAVGLSTKVLPHNFIELIKASIKILEEKSFQLFPDFQTGGSIDVSEYNRGKRGGRVKVRAKIHQVDKKTINITELPYGVTTTSLIDSIIKANEKGKIRIKKVVDNTAKDVEIAIELAPGVSPDVAIDALYAFTSCEISISPNACVIVDNKPIFTEINELLKISTFHTKALLKRELEIKLSELHEKWHHSSLEKIFIQERIYHEIEDCETWEAVIETIDVELKKYVRISGDKTIKNDTRIVLMRKVLEDDIIKLTEIKIKRISKYNKFKADELIQLLEADIEKVKFNLNHLTEFAIDYFTRLLDKYGKDKSRRTEVTSFETIKRTQVVANNTKLYVNRQEGFLGFGLKKDEFIAECSDIALIIAFRKNGEYSVHKIDEKVFVGKNIIHIDIWKKGDDRTTYNAIYVDGKTGKTMAKRFNVTAITRDKAYDVTSGAPKSRLLYFSPNKNGEAETVSITLSPTCSARNKVFIYDFHELDIKGRSSKGNTVSKYPVKKVLLDELGKSTLGAIKIWMDEVSGRLNQEKRGKFLGAFDTGDTILAIYKNGSYVQSGMQMTQRFDVENLMWIGKYYPDNAINCIYYDVDKSWTLAKRFYIETSKLDQPYIFISEERGTKLYYVTANSNPIIQYSYKTNNIKQQEELNIESFIDIKGWKSMGNKLLDHKILSIKELSSEAPMDNELVEIVQIESPLEESIEESDKSMDKEVYKPGDSIDFDDSGQGKLF